MNDLKIVIRVLEYLIGQANSYHDDSESPEHAEAVELLERFKDMENPPKRSILSLATHKAINEHRH